MKKVILFIVWFICLMMIWNFCGFLISYPDTLLMLAGFALAVLFGWFSIATQCFTIFNINFKKEKK